MRVVKTALLASSLALACWAGAAERAVAELVNSEGERIGQARFEQAPHGVILLVEVAGLPPGAHGIHLHGAGSCAPDFKAARGHINPSAVEHGLRNPKGPDPGDLPNLFVAADGTAKAEFYTTRVRVAAADAADAGAHAAADGEQPALLDADGSAVIIHANPDDHLTQPIGGAGGRIGCGKIVKMTQPPAEQE